MGTKQAGLHFFTQNPEGLLPKLKSKFNKAPGPGAKDISSMALLRAMAEKNIKKSCATEQQLAEKTATLDAIISQGLREVGKERALVVIGKDVVSLYWYDQIRTDNLAHEAKKYSKLLGVPALGLALYDDDDVIICATDGTALQSGAYRFSQNDVEPAEPETLCALLGIKDKTAGVINALMCQNGERMIKGLEKAFGIALFAEAETLKKAGNIELACWPGADLFRGQKI